MLSSLCTSLPNTKLKTQKRGWPHSCIQPSLIRARAAQGFKAMSWIPRYEAAMIACCWQDTHSARPSSVRSEILNISMPSFGDARGLISYHQPLSEPPKQPAAQLREIVRSEEPTAVCATVEYGLDQNIDEPETGAALHYGSRSNFQPSQISRGA